jgi:hypothetical protein
MGMVAANVNISCQERMKKFLSVAGGPQTPAQAPMAGGRLGVAKMRERATLAWVH